MKPKKLTPAAISKRTDQIVELDKPELLEDFISVDKNPSIDFALKKYPHSTPITKALELGHISVFKKLLEMGCDVFKTNSMGVSPLEMAAWRDMWDVVENSVKCASLSLNYKKEKNNAIDGLLRASLAKGNLNMLKLAQSLGGKVDKKPEYGELPDKFILNHQEWQDYKKNRQDKPNFFANNFSPSNIYKQEGSKMLNYSGNRLPLEVYAISASNEIKVWCQKNGINTEVDKIPEKYKLLFLMMSLESETMPVSFKSIIMLVDSLKGMFSKKEDKLWLWLKSFHIAISRRNFMLQTNINKYVQEKYDVSMVNSMWPYVYKNQDHELGPLMRDYNPMFILINSSGQSDSIDSDEYTPTSVILPNSLLKDINANRDRSRRNLKQIKHLFDLGFSLNTVERGWNYNLLHIAASSGAHSVIGFLCENFEFDPKIFAKRSGKKERGRTPKEMARNNGKDTSYILLENAELKAKFGVSKKNNKKNYDNAL